MSRLYITKRTDMSKTGNRGRNYATAEIRWGSKGDSKLAVKVDVVWKKDAKYPEVIVKYGDELVSEIIEEEIL